MTWINTPKKLKKNQPKNTKDDESEEESLDLKKRKIVKDDESESDENESKKVPEGENVLYFTD